MRLLAACALAARASAQEQVVPSGIFDRVQGMTFSVGDGAANDVAVGCPDEYAAAQATTETATGPLATPDMTTWDYMQAVALANVPYSLDGSETQEFIDIYACLSTLRPSDFQGVDPPAGAADHGCGYQLDFDYGGNPSYRAADGSIVECGYADVLSITTNVEGWEALAWYSGPVLFAADMTSPRACQNTCALVDGSAYYTYVWEFVDDAYQHECYCKSAFVDDPLTPDDGACGSLPLARLSIIVCLPKRWSNDRVFCGLRDDGADESVLCATPVAAVEESCVASDPAATGTDCAFTAGDAGSCGADCTYTAADTYSNTNPYLAPLANGESGPRGPCGTCPADFDCSASANTVDVAVQCAANGCAAASCCAVAPAPAPPPTPTASSALAGPAGSAALAAALAAALWR